MAQEYADNHTSLKGCTELFFDLAAGGEIMLRKGQEGTTATARAALVARGVAYLPQMAEGLLLHRVLRQCCLGIVDGLAGVAVGGSFLQHGRDGLDVERTGSVDYLVELQKGLLLLLKSFLFFRPAVTLGDVRETRRATNVTSTRRLTRSLAHEHWKLRPLLQQGGLVGAGKRRST